MTTDQTAMTTAAPPPGTIARQEFGAQQITTQAETASTAIAAQLQAATEARYIMAIRRPRDWDDVRIKVLRELEREGFAEIAWYRKPIGKGVEGFSVRFTDMAARCCGNILEEAPIVYEDTQRRIVRILVTDLESNLTKWKDVPIEKTVERSSLTDGRIAINVRKNSRGDAVYLVPATEDEMLGKDGALSAKVRRNLILQILPGDIQDAAKARILALRRKEDTAKDPEAARRKIVDSFAQLNVLPSDLKAFLGHDVAQCVPAELQDLRDLYSSIVSGEATWAEAIAEKRGTPAAENTTTATAQPRAGLDGLKDKLKGAADAEGPKKE